MFEQILKIIFIIINTSIIKNMAAVYFQCGVNSFIVLIYSIDIWSSDADLEVQ
jgi:hypothetical protein